MEAQPEPTARHSVNTEAKRLNRIVYSRVNEMNILCDTGCCDDDLPELFESNGVDVEAPRSATMKMDSWVGKPYCAIGGAIKS